MLEITRFSRWLFLFYLNVLPPHPCEDLEANPVKTPWTKPCLKFVDKYDIVIRICKLKRAGNILNYEHNVTPRTCEKKSI